MAYDVVFASGLFDGDVDQKESAEALLAMLDALTRIDADYLRRHPEVPPLYLARIPYRQEPPGQERWQDVPTTLARGHADCEDFSAWRAAELAVRAGVPARPVVSWRKLPSGSYLYHIRVQWPDGRIEDPSAFLGMPQGAFATLAPTAPWLQGRQGTSVVGWANARRAA